MPENRIGFSCQCTRFWRYVQPLPRGLTGRARSAVRVLTSLFTAAVAGLIAFHGSRFVWSEREYGSEAFAGLPAWIFESIIPFAFGMIALRYLLLAVGSARSLGSDGSPGQ